MKTLRSVGIVGYGAYVPRPRLATELSTPVTIPGFSNSFSIDSKLLLTISLIL